MQKNSFSKVVLMVTLSLLIIASSVFSSISPLFMENNRAFAADGTEQAIPNDSGGVINPQIPQEFEDSIISKTATYTGTPGEYFIDLKVQGKEKEEKEPTDIVIVYDNSNSMNNNNRVTIARNAVTSFINHTLTADNDSIRIALVTFGTNVMDGRRNEVYGGNTDDYSHKTFTTHANTLINKIPRTTPDHNSRKRSNDGGTNIQQGLQVAHEILSDSNVKNKIIVTITDGSPTVSYENGVIKGNGTNFIYDGNKNHGTNTIAEAVRIQNDGIDMYSIGIELTGDAGSTLEQVTHVMKNIASSPEKYYNANQVDDLVDILTGLAIGITGTINEGVVTDPMSEFVNLALTDGEFKRASNAELTDGSYYLSAADPKFLTGVTVGYENNTITLSNLMLGKDQYVNIRYKVNINTDKDGFNGTDYFPTNGTTTLIPDITEPDSPTREYIVPKVKGLTHDISGTKIWEDTGGEMNRPTEIELELYRTTGDRSDGTLVDSVTVTPDSNNEWIYNFGMKPAYSSIGQIYEYYIKEITVDGYTTTYSEDNFDVTNTLISEPNIELTKTSDTETITEVGQKVIYTFEIKNTGNVTLNNLTLNDPMLGGAITLDNTELAPGESTTVSKEYTVTQSDIDNGNVHNIATVKGEDPKGETPEDEDEVDVPVNQQPGISLVKEADRTDLVADENINYTFTATNTGNVTLTQVNLTDILEGLSGITYVSINDDEVTVDEVDGIVLNPGDVLVANASYTVTQADVDNGIVSNEATVFGTPPNVDEPIQAKDDVTIEQNVAGSLDLEKTSNVETITEAGQIVTYTFTITNDSNVTVKNITLDDPMLGGTVELEKTTLAPGESITVSEDYTVTQSDIDNGNVHNIATVKGEDPKGETPEDEDEVDVPVEQNPSIDLVKEADRTDLVVGEKVNYTFTATNTGNVTLNKVNLVDELEGISDINYVSINGEEIEDDEAITLKPGDVLIANANYTITQADIDAGVIENNATVYGTPANSDEPISDIDKVTITDDFMGSLVLEKISDIETIFEAGEVVTYTFTITNDSKVTMKNITLDDPMLGGDIELEKTTLAPGESITVSEEYTVTQSDIDNGNVHNIATVKGEDPKGNTPTDEDEVTIVGTQDSKLTLEKTSDTKEITEAGQVVTYNFKVTNNGNVTIKNIVLDDPMLGGTVELEKTTLAPGESITVSKDYTVRQSDIDNGNIHNIATVKGEDPKGETPEDEDEVEVPVNQNPSINLVKIADRNDLVVGENINYTFTATNTGNVTLNKVNLIDELEGISDITYVSVNGEDIEDVEAITLKPGDVLLANASYTVTQDDVDSGIVENKATVFGTPTNSEEPVSDTDSVSVPQDVQGNLTLEKSSDTTDFTEAGQTIVYNFVITNNSNVTMKHIKLDDPMLGGDIELENTMLNPGKSITVSKEYTVTQDDLDNGEIVNVATVTGEDPRGNTSTDEDEVTIVGTQDSQLTLEKTSDTKEITEAGQVVTYNFKVTNNGNITIKNIVLDDPMLGGNVELEKTTLAPGESITVSKDYTVTQEDLNNGEVQNIATVTGETPDGEMPEDEDEVTIPGKSAPNITLEKTSDVKEVENVGDVVNYTFTITNNGNVDLHRVILNDPMLGGNIELESTSLKVGESIKVSVQHKVTEEQLKYATITNKAIASGLSPKNELVYDIDDVVLNTVLPIVVPKPEGEITKEVNGKGGYRVADNGETFAFDIKALLKEGQDIETLTILDEIDERLEIESVDVTIDEDTIIETSAEDIKKLESEKLELESDLTVLESELEALEATLAQTKEKEAEEETEESEVTESDEEVEVTESTEEVEVTEPTEEETEAPVEESTEVETQDPIVEEEVTEPAEEVEEPVVEEESNLEDQEPATEESEESEEVSEPKGAKPINTEAIEAAIEELKAQINTLKAEIEDIDVEINELKENNIDLKAGSILEHGELVQNGQSIEFKITEKEVIKALEGQTIKMTIKAKFKTIDDDALTNGVENTATVTFGDKPKDTNTVVVYPIKEEEPTPVEPEVPEEPEEPVKPTPEPEVPEVPEKPTPQPEKTVPTPPTKEVPKVTPPVEKAPETPAKPKVEEKEKLPETGEAHNTNYGVVIGLALAGALMLLISRRRKTER